MARMHARKRGKSGSTKPAAYTDQKWVKFKPAEIEQLVIKFAKQGNTSAKIGMHLRDSYGIADVKEITGKKITAIMRDNKLAPEFPEDLLNLIRRSIHVRKHLDINKKDTFSKRGLQLIEAKIRRLEKYYKKEGVLGSSYIRKRVELSVR